MAVISGAWETLKEAIEVYTGVSPATFFVAVAVAVAFYHVITGFLAQLPQPRNADRDFLEAEPLPPPVQIGEVTEEELRKYDGSDPKKPLLMAIKGQIYDVSQSRIFYGPGGPYALFAGKDASRALAKMSFEETDLNGNLSGLGPCELDALQDWEYRFMGKYAKVGMIKKPVSIVDGEPSPSAPEVEAASKENTPSEPIQPREVAEKSDVTEEHKEANCVKDDTVTVEDESSGNAVEVAAARSVHIPSVLTEEHEKPDTTIQLNESNKVENDAVMVNGESNGNDDDIEPMAPGTPEKKVECTKV